ncbi:hypothetical protein BST61_g9581 [Cercospora zeina]
MRICKHFSPRCATRRLTCEGLNCHIRSERHSCRCRIWQLDPLSTCPETRNVVHLISASMSDDGTSQQHSGRTSGIIFL